MASWTTIAVQAQNSQGTILGHVQDASGAALSGALVTATNLSTNVTRHFTTTAGGDYVLVDIIPGTYSVKVEANGFKSAVSTGLVLEVDQTLRQDIGDSAVKLAEAIGYVGAGTIEFLLDADGSFYFMEMNTRIQVEHPVTEMCTNFDLVKEQISVAAGAPLSLVMNGHRLRGHAIECRVNAEDPARNFQPSPGLITAYHPPGGPGVRVDTHIYAGYTVPPYYDSLLAKVIVHGNTRTEALARMRQALDSFIIEGVTTTIPFLGRVMRHPDFVAGKIDTKFLEREPHLLKDPT